MLNVDAFLNTLIELCMCKAYLQIESDLCNNSKLVCGSVIVER